MYVVQSAGLNQTDAPHSHHLFDDLPQSSSFDVLCDEVQSLVFVQDSNELEHIRMIQATHDLHLRRRNTEI